MSVNAVKNYREMSLWLTLKQANTEKEKWRLREKQMLETCGLFWHTQSLLLANPPPSFFPVQGLSGFCKVYPARTSSESSRQLGKWHTLLLCTNNCTHKHTLSAVTRQDAVLACHCKRSCQPVSALIFLALQLNSTKTFCLSAATVKDTSIKSLFFYMFQTVENIGCMKNVYWLYPSCS